MIDIKYNISSQRNKKINLIHPILELEREKIIKKLLSKFNELANKYCSNSIGKFKTDDIFLRFCWKNISEYDPVIPYEINGKYDVSQLRIDLSNINGDYESILHDMELNNVLKENIKTLEEIQNNLRKDKLPYANYENDKLIYEDEYVVCNEKIYEKLDRFFNNKFDNKHVLFFCLLKRYEIMGDENQQLAIPEDLKKKLKTNINFELFGSAINRFYDNYCSLFYDLEQYFGSVGNFFDIELEQGIYIANPPFDEEIMKNMALKLIDSLDKTDKPLVFLVFIPAWDFKISKELHDKCNTRLSYDKPFECYEILKQSKYFTKEHKYCKQEFKYYNIKTDKEIGVVNTIALLLQNIE